MIRTRLFCFTALLMLSKLGFGQNNDGNPYQNQNNVLTGNRDITFKAIDANTHKGIPFATIFLENAENHKSYIGKSNEHGVLINRIPDGQYQVDGLIDGYKREIFGIKTDEERNIALILIEKIETKAETKKVEVIELKKEIVEIKKPDTIPVKIEEIAQIKEEEVKVEEIAPEIIEKKEYIPNSTRKSLNLIILIDVSKSMNNQNRLNQLKSSLINLVNNFESNDRLALMTFNDQVNTLLESQFIKDKKIPIDLINSINPNGSTDGVMGIDKSFEILKSNYQPDALNMVILASDGKISPYAADDKKFYEKVEQMNEQAILTSVVGFGSSQYETAKLNKISVIGGGVFIDMNSVKENQESILLDEIYKTLLKVKK
jgi:Mg-chelatase subunit ChlD